MKGILRKCFHSILFAAFVHTGFAQPLAGSATLPANETSSIDDNFGRGNFETALSAGPMFSPFGNPHSRPVLNYAVGSLQLGYMATQIHGDGSPLRGNLELAVEGFGDGIYQGIGTYITGGTLWFRYNFVPRHWVVTPYLQLGGGFVLTDANRYLLGENFNFNLDAALGARYFITPRWTLNLEYRYQHISNADISNKNVGINAQGPILGVSCFF